MEDIRLENLSKEGIEAFAELAETVIGEVVFILLEEGKISEEDEVSTIMDAVCNNDIYKQFVEDPCLSITYIDDLKSSIDLEIKHEYFHQVIVLAVMCIEHILNGFFGRYLSYKLNMDDEQINGILSSNNINAKVGDLYYLTFRKEFPEKLRSNIQALNRIRNKFVHYKYGIKDDEKDTYEYMSKMAKASKATVNNLIDFIDKREKELYPNIIKKQKIMGKINFKNTIQYFDHQK